MLRFFALLSFFGFGFCPAAFAQNKGIKQLFAETYFYTSSNDSLSLEAILAQSADSVIYIDFWASWCRPCIDEMPHSKTLAQELAGKPVVFLYLSLDDSESNWQRALQNLEFAPNARHYRRPIKTSQEFLNRLFIYGIPHYMLVDKDNLLANRDAFQPSLPAARKQLLKMLNKKPKKQPKK